MNILLIEDEHLAAQRLAKLLKELQPEATILDTLDSVESAVNYLMDSNLAQLIFMDIQLADGTSFEIFEHVTPTCPVIFTTAYDEFAIQALRLGAVDYLLKPIKKEDLQAALTRVKQRNVPTILPNEIKDKYPSQRFMIKIGNQVKVIDYQEVNYFFSEEKITFAVLTSGKRYPINQPLDKLEMTLSNDFFRANRQIIVKKTAVAHIHTYTKSRLKLTLSPTFNEEVIVSTEKAGSFKKWLVE